MQTKPLYCWCGYDTDMYWNCVVSMSGGNWKQLSPCVSVCLRQASASISGCPDAREVQTIRKPKTDNVQRETATMVTWSLATYAVGGWLWSSPDLESLHMVYTVSTHGINLVVPSADMVSAKTEAGGCGYAYHHQQLILATGHGHKSLPRPCFHCGMLPKQIRKNLVCAADQNLSVCLIYDLAIIIAVAFVCAKKIGGG